MIRFILLSSLMFFNFFVYAQSVRPPIEALANKESYKNWLLAQSNLTLYEFALKKFIGTCQIANTTTCTTCSCPYYVINVKKTWAGWKVNGTTGMPGNEEQGATGCAPGCYPESGYTPNMCDGTSESRMGEQIRWGLNAGTDIAFAADGDPCGLAEFLTKINIAQSIDLRGLTQSGGVAFDPNNKTKCMLLKGAIGNEYTQYLSPMICKILANSSPYGAGNITSGVAMSLASPEQIKEAEVNTNANILQAADTAYATEMIVTRESDYILRQTSLVQTKGPTSTTDTAPTPVETTTAIEQPQQVLQLLR